MSNTDAQSFDDVASRINEIVDLVSDETLPLDEALGLYEEAVELGLRVSSILEDDIEVDDTSLQETEEKKDASSSL